MKMKYPKVNIDLNQQVYVSFYIDNKRFRLFNGTRIGSNTNPNSFPVDQRYSLGNILAAEVYDYILSGGKIEKYRSHELICGELSDLDYLRLALNSKLNSQASVKYKKSLQFSFDSIVSVMKGNNLKTKDIRDFLDRYSSGVSYNTNRRHLSVLINEAISLGMKQNPMSNIKSRKSLAKINKPYKNLSVVLDEIKAYNENLYLCCLLTYGCLLRPHREIRELTWGDFSEDLSVITLDGSRNKSGKNRIVPVPSYIRINLSKGLDHYNIFTSNPEPLNSDYFKTLWSRFKAQSVNLQPDQTLYSFRHSGAIEIFKRTGSLAKVQQAMGHSSLNISLTYLRGLNIGQLSEEDMPMI